MKQNEEKETDRILIRLTMVVYILLVLIFTVGADLAYAKSASACRDKQSVDIHIRTDPRHRPDTSGIRHSADRPFAENPMIRRSVPMVF